MTRARIEKDQHRRSKPNAGLDGQDAPVSQILNLAAPYLEAIPTRQRTLSLAFPARCCDKVLGKHRVMIGHNDALCRQRFLELPQIEIDALPFLVDISDSF